MQVSSSIQALSPGGYENSPGVENSGEVIHENAQDGSVWESRNSKKAKPGLFARLLDGLTGKTKKSGSTGSDFSANLIKKEQEDSASGEGFLAVKNAKFLASSKKASLGGIGAEISGEGQIIPTTGNIPQALFSGGESLLAEERSGALALEQFTARQSAAELSARQQSTRDQIAETERQNLSANQQLLFNDEQGLEDLNGENASLFRQRENKAGRAAVDMFTPRNQENRFVQVSGEPKPGLVDAMGLGRGAETEATRRSENRGKRSEKLSVEVRDLRTGETRPNNATESIHSTSSANLKTAVEVEIPVDLSIKTGAVGEKAQDSSFSKPGAFEDALARELRENLNTDIVRQASIILRNGGEGVIRLSLRPETLGTVKIRLEMTENKITGHIIVENSEALRAFERELPVLEKAFQDSGFSETDLDMFLSQDQGNYSPEGGENGEYPYFSPELAASMYEPETEIREIPKGIFLDESGRTSVNVLI